jgi:hypothetical protein
VLCLDVKVVLTLNSELGWLAENVDASMKSSVQLPSFSQLGTAQIQNFNGN